MKEKILFIEEMGNDLHTYAIMLNAIKFSIENSENPKQYVPGLEEIEHKLNVLANRCKWV